MPAIVANALALLMFAIPVQCVVLPMNMAPADLLSALVLPICWIWLVHARRPLRLPYFPAFAVIGAATTISCLLSLDPVDSAGTLVKEAYLYVWFLTFGSTLGALPERYARRVLWAWAGAGLANGALIVAQFVRPDLLAAMNSGLSGIGALDPFRPSGLFENCNAAALFQLSAFVPVLVLRLPPLRTMALVLVLLAMMLGTGSMGALLALVLGLLALVVGLVLRRQWDTAAKLVGAVAVVAAVLVLAGLVLLATDAGLQQRIEYVMTGRGGYSAESRFGIWSRGADVLLADLPPFGVGPDMWKRIDGHELHNDLLSFAVERGLLAVAGLLLLVVAAAVRAVQVVRRVAPAECVAALALVAGLAGLLVMGQTHEVLHQRPVWLVLALVEASWWRTHDETVRPAAAALPVTALVRARTLASSEST